MDMTQVALLIVAVNLGVLGLGFVVAAIRSVTRRRRDPEGTTAERSSS